MYIGFLVTIKSSIMYQSNGQLTAIFQDADASCTNKPQQASSAPLHPVKRQGLSTPPKISTGPIEKSHVPLNYHMRLKPLQSNSSHLLLNPFQSLPKPSKRLQ